MKAKKFEFKRNQGKFIPIEDRQWILRTYYIMKAKAIIQDDRALKDLIVEISGCSIDSIEEIISLNEHKVQDNRGHNMIRKISRLKENKIKREVIENLKLDLQDGIPVCSRDVRAWLQREKNISLSKTVMLSYLKNWGIDWRMLRKEEFRKEREAVLIQRQEFLQVMMDEFRECRHIKNCKCAYRKDLWCSWMNPIYMNTMSQIMD